MVTITTIFILQGVVGLLFQLFKRWEIADFANYSVIWAFFYVLFLMSGIVGILYLMFQFLP